MLLVINRLRQSHQRKGSKEKPKSGSSFYVLLILEEGFLFFVVPKISFSAAGLISDKGRRKRLSKVQRNIRQMLKSEASKTPGLVFRKHTPQWKEFPHEHLVSASCRCLRER